MTNYYSFEAVNFLPILPYVVILIFIVVVVLVLRVSFNFRKMLKQEQVFLELTPPAFTEKSAYTTKQLFSVLHNIGSQRSFVDRLLGRKILFSFEIVSTRKEGIRYVVRTALEQADILKKGE